MPNVTVALTPNMVTELEKTDVKGYAVYFDAGGGSPQWMPLDSSNWTPTGGGGATVSLSPAGAGLKIYFILQSMRPGDVPLHTGGAGGGHPSDAILIESQIVPAGTPSSAQTLNYRYDSFEVSFTPAAADAGNLTDIDGFGIPMAIEVVYTGTTPNTSASRGYLIPGGGVGTSGTIWNELQSAGGAGSIQDFTGGGLSGPRMAISPAAAIGNKVSGTNYSVAKWIPYVSSLQASGATTPGAPNQIQIAGYFNGAHDANRIWHNAGYYAYDVTYTGSNFILTPGATSQIQGTITISTADLANSIYMTLGNATVSGLSTGTGTGATTTLAMNTGANNEWGTVLRDFVTGFTAGYWDASATSLNPNVSGSIVLNKEWNQDPTYAFGGSVASGHGSVTPGANVFYDEYAKVFFNKTNSYGNGYSDFLTRAFNVGPLINVSDGSGHAVDSNNITVTLFADNDTPTGYTQQVINNYLPAGSGGYLVPSGVNTNGIETTLNFNVGTMSLKAGTPVQIVLKGATSASDVALPVISAFGNYQVTSGSGGYALTPYGVVDAGVIKLKDLPVTPATSSTGVNWYQIEVGSGAARKTFNLYETVDTSGNIWNPGYAGGVSSAISVDGLATITGTGPGQFITSDFGMTINFQNGGNNTLDPSLMAQGSGTDTPSAPLVGLRPGYTSASGAPFLETYEAWNAGPSMTVYNGGLVFGWTGADSTAVQQQTALTNFYVQNYTNRINGGDVARLVFSAASGSTLPASGLSSSGTGGGTIYFTTATADTDGIWATGTPIQFANGTYTVQMQEFLPTDTAFANPLNGASVVQSFTVQQGAIISSGASAGSSVTIGPTQSSAGLTVGTGGTVIVLGGTASATMVSAGGVMSAAVGSSDIGSIILGTHYVSSGAAASNTTVASGGHDYVYGTTSAASVNVGGAQVVCLLSNPTAIGTTLNSGAHQHIKSQGSAVNAVVLGGGVQVADSGGVTTNTALYSGGLLHISSGGTASGSVVSGGDIHVFAGGVESAAQFLGSGGREFVYAGGVVSGATLLVGNNLYVYSGGIGGGTIQGGAYQYVYSGGLASSSTLVNNGRMYVYAGGSSTSATVQGGGIENVGGSGAIAISATVQSGSYEHIHGGASAVSANLQTSGYQWVWHSGTTATNTSVGSGASQNVYLGASASGTTIGSGGWQLVWDAGTTASGTNVQSGGQMQVYNSGFATGVTIFGGTEVVYAAGITSGTTVNGGAEYVNAGGTATGTTVNSGGFQYNFGAAIGTTLSAGGVGYAFSGGIMTSAQISAGGVGHAWSGTMTSAQVGSGGKLHIVTSGVASGTMINNGGVEYVWAGGTDSGTTVGSGGLQVLLQTGSLATGTTVVAGGSAQVSSGSVASGITVSGTGQAYVFSGGTVKDATLNGGFLEILSGGGASGSTVTFGISGGTVKLDDSVDLTSGGGGISISGLTSGAGAIDFGDIGYTAGVTSHGWVQSGTSGTLTLTSGALHASIVLFGNYFASSFNLATDGAAGTLVTEPATGGSSQNLLTPPHG
ncbi:MAG: hypothetical protein Q8L22_14025 [Reyranella sp.]|nr:hypothetical protein [Reyranella sp.]